MILVTGGASYLGCNCASLLLDKGFEVLIADNLSKGRIENVSKLSHLGKLNFSPIDLANLHELNILFNNFNIDSIIHTLDISKNNDETFIITTNLLSMMKKYRTNKIIFSTTKTNTNNNKTENIINKFYEKYEINYSKVYFKAYQDISSLCNAYFYELQNSEKSLKPYIINSTI